MNTNFYFCGRNLKFRYDADKRKSDKNPRAASRANSKSKYKSSGTFYLIFRGITSFADQRDAQYVRNVEFRLKIHKPR